jgi:hypothetical protein
VIYNYDGCLAAAGSNREDCNVIVRTGNATAETNGQGLGASHPVAERTVSTTLSIAYRGYSGELTGLDHSNVERSFRVPTTISSFASGTPSSGKFRWHDTVAHEIC